MTSPAITQVPDATLAVVMATLSSHDISALPIVHYGRLVGIVSTTDLVTEATRTPASGHRVAGDIMRAPVFVIGPGDPLEEAARRMGRARVHRLVVVEEERPVGVVSARDILADVKKARITRPIAEVMTKDVVTIDIGDPIDEAVAKLDTAHVHGLVVLDGTRPIGVFTHAEALASQRFPPELRRSPVEEVMSYETICLDASTPIYRAAGHAIAMNVRRILVVERGHLVGILSALDLIGALPH